MARHFASVSWHGVRACAAERYVHVASSAKGREAAEASARKWASDHLTPAACAGAEFTYLGKND